MIIDDKIKHCLSYINKKYYCLKLITLKLITLRKRGIYI